MSGKTEKKKCDLCHKTTNNQMDVHLFGDWMEHRGIRVHYFCLLLSTNLPQNGRDVSGILGFLMRDIRKEINLAQKRRCVYCKEQHASLKCQKCKQYFHLECGLNNKCLFRFIDDFRSYCDLCLPLDDTQSKLVKTPPSSNTCCYICEEAMGLYFPTLWIYGKCCGNGYVHRICMQKYASTAGYYLKCVWCKDEQFREVVKEQGIFVPDRDAQWEQEKGAFSDLYRKHNHCDIETCLCPRGRDYITTIYGKWNFIICTLCGCFGGHNMCIMRKLKSSEKVEGFKCELCAKTEARMEQQNETRSQGSVHSCLSDMDNKTRRNLFQKKRKCSLQNENDTNEVISFSQDTTVSNSSNQESCDEMQTDVICKEMLIENPETVEKSPAKVKDFDRSIFQTKWQSLLQNESHINESHLFPENKTVSNNSHQNLGADVASVDMLAENLRPLYISSNASIKKLIPLVIQNSEQNIERHDTGGIATQSQNMETNDMLNQHDNQSSPTEGIGSVRTHNPVAVSGHNSEYENEGSDEIESISDISMEGTDSENEESGDIESIIVIESTSDILSISDISASSGDENEEFNLTDISYDSSQNENIEDNVFEQFPSENSNDHNCVKTQSPTKSSSSQTTQSIENFTCFDMYEFDGEMNCLGTCTVRIDFTDPRFADKSLDEIKGKMDLIRESDIIARNSDIVFWRKRSRKSPSPVIIIADIGQIIIHKQR